VSAQAEVAMTMIARIVRMQVLRVIVPGILP
jgi:hypothetical protein